MEALYFTGMSVDDIHAEGRRGYPGRKLYTPKPYENNKDIKGIYNYVTYTLQPRNVTWDEVALRYCSEELGMNNLNGKGSVRMAAKLVQENWKNFVIWANKIYNQ